MNDIKFLDNLSSKEIKELEDLKNKFNKKIISFVENSQLFKKTFSNEFLEPSHISIKSFFSNSMGLSYNSYSQKFEWKKETKYSFLDSSIDDARYRPIHFIIYRDESYACIEISDLDYGDPKEYNHLITKKEKEILEGFRLKAKEFFSQIVKYEESRSEKNEMAKKVILNKFDKQQIGKVDLIDSDTFSKLLTKNQKLIVDLDKTYIQKFVKVSNYLKLKKENINKIFESIKDVKYENDLNELVGLLKNQIHVYELLLFHSINMISSAVENDLITFYEIYECFDQLGIFNSNWENDVSNKLTEIGSGLKNLMHSINQMEYRIINSIQNLSYLTYDSFRQLNLSVENQLKNINSSLKYNNLLTGIQTYKMYVFNEYTINPKI